MVCRNIDVVIISFNGRGVIGPCIDSLPGPGGVGARITVVDNASTDGTADMIEGMYPSVHVIRNQENAGYARAVNAGAKSVAGGYLLIVNQDVVFYPGTVSKLVEYLDAHRDTGVVGVQQVFPDGRWQRSYGDVPGLMEGVKDLAGITSFGNWVRRLAWPWAIDRLPKEVGYADGAMLAVRREAFDCVDGFDGGFFFYGEEADFCYRVRKAGWKVMFLPAGRIMHIRGGSSTRADAGDKYLKMLVGSKLRLVGRHRPPWQARLYALAEKAHAAKLELACRLLGWLAPAGHRERLGVAAMKFNRLASIWGEMSVRKGWLK